MAYSKDQLVAYAREAARRYGVDPDIYVRQINQESRWNPKAKSSAGALGIAQFMPDTAKDYGIDPLDPIQSLDAGARYMASSLKTFKGSYPLALASYNAGVGAVKKHGGVPPYKETQHYVRTIMGGPDVRTVSGDYGPGSTDTMRVPTGDPRTGEMDMQGYETPPQAGSQPSVLATLPPQLQELWAGLLTQQQQPSKQERLLSMLGSLGRGILSAGGGPGAGNWFGAGLNQVAADQAAQAEQFAKERQSKLYEAQLASTLFGQLGFTQPSQAEQARAKSDVVFLVDPRNPSDYLPMYWDKLRGTYVTADGTSRPVPPEFLREAQRGGKLILRQLPGGGSGGADVKAYGPNGEPVLLRPGETTATPVEGIGSWTLPPEAKGGAAGWDKLRVFTPPGGEPVQMTYEEWDALSPEEKRALGPAQKAGTVGSRAGKGTGSADIVKIDAALIMMDAMEQDMFGPNGAFTTGNGQAVEGAFGRLFRGVANAYNELTQEDIAAEKYERQLASIAGTLAKAFGDTGTLSEGDIKRALDAMPRSKKILPDSTSYAREAFNSLRRVLMEKRTGLGGATLPPGGGEQVMPPQAGGGLSVGDIQKGYRFKGGNPADKASWEKI